jgi:glycine C-acetyltransferase
LDLFDKLSLEKSPIGQYSKWAHGYFTFPKLEGELAPRMQFRGKEVLCWSLNNYLGLGNHPEVREADASGSANYGLSYPMGARMMSGNSEMHETFEKELSEFVKKEDTILLNYGYQGILSAIDAVVDRKDVIVYDSECHACIVDGVRLHQGKRFVFPHNNIENCKKQLERATKITRETGGGILLITEGVFGMSGDQGDLKSIVNLKTDFRFRLMVDDAHGFGTLGATGAGAGEEQGVMKDIDIYFSTFAKSMAGIGGFVSATAEVVQYLRYTMRSQIFAKSVPMPFVIGLRKRLELLRTKPELKEKLWENVNALQGGLRAKGFNLGNTQSPVTPVFLNGGDKEASKVIYDLRENYSIFCSAVVYPVVPKGVLMLRLIPTSVHSLDDVKITIDAFEDIAEKLKSNFYNTFELPLVAEREFI